MPASGSLTMQYPATQSSPSAQSPPVMHSFPGGGESVAVRSPPVQAASAKAKSGKNRTANLGMTITPISPDAAGC